MSGCVNGYELAGRIIAATGGDPETIRYKSEAALELMRGLDRTDPGHQHLLQVYSVLWPIAAKSPGFRQDCRVCGAASDQLITGLCDSCLDAERGITE